MQNLMVLYFQGVHKQAELSVVANTQTHAQTDA